MNLYCEKPKKKCLKEIRLKNICSDFGAAGLMCFGLVLFTLADSQVAGPQRHGLLDVLQNGRINL